MARERLKPSVAHDILRLSDAEKGENMFDGTYNDTVIDHFMSPRNAGTMPDADAEGSFGDSDCGDYLTLYLKVTNSVIREISFLVFGCAAAIASSSMTTVLAKGRTLEEAEAITEKEIADALGGLPEHKLHCSMLGVSALRNAIEAYRKSHPA